VRIIWNPNPLATVIELDDHDKALLRLRLKIEDLQERLLIAHFTLSRDGGKAPLADRVATAVAKMDVVFILDDERRDGLSFDESLDAELVRTVDDLAGVHSGDCTCAPSSCLKCIGESLVGTDTTAGLGKHPGAKIYNAFLPASKGDPVPTLEEAIDSIRDFRPTMGPEWKRGEEDFKQHVPRWIREAKEAHEWLLAYQREHFGERP
jgi:hypothetical protein